MTAPNPAPYERETPSELAEHEPCWSLVPDKLSPTGWTTVFEDGSYVRGWSPLGA